MTPNLLSPSQARFCQNYDEKSAKYAYCYRVVVRKLHYLLHFVVSCAIVVSPGPKADNENLLSIHKTSSMSCQHPKPGRRHCCQQQTVLTT